MQPDEQEGERKCNIQRIHLHCHCGYAITIYEVIIGWVEREQEQESHANDSLISDHTELHQRKQKIAK